MMTNRYETGHIAEGQFQAGSDDKVLKNKLDIINPNEMDEVELALLVQLTDVVLDEIINEQIISSYIPHL